MKYTLTEHEINEKGWWENYGKLRGVGYWSHPEDQEVSFTETEMNQLKGLEPIEEEVSKEDAFKEWYENNRIPADVSGSSVDHDQLVEWLGKHKEIVENFLDIFETSL